MANGTMTRGRQGTRGGRSNAGRGRGRGRASPAAAPAPVSATSRLTDTQSFNKLPEELKAWKTGGWTAVQMDNKPLKVVEEKVFEDDYIAPDHIGMFRHIASSVKASLEGLGQPVKSESIFRFLLNSAVHDIITCTT